MDKTMEKHLAKKMKKQSTEFDAVVSLAAAYGRLPAVVDDDYPEMRHHYESALQTLIKALKNNGRI